MFLCNDREDNLHSQVSITMSEDDEMGLNESYKSLKFISIQYFHTVWKYDVKMSTVELVDDRK